MVISGTFVSRESMMDAWKYSIDVSGHLSTHAGFDLTKPKGEKPNLRPLGVTTVGLGKEPINAWLPLYICATHWKRALTLLKPTLGYFCTLDDLGYSYKQLEVMFLVLGHMICELRPDNAGEHQLRLLFAFQRTCTGE